MQINHNIKRELQKSSTSVVSRRFELITPPPYCDCLPLCAMLSNTGRYIFLNWTVFSMDWKCSNFFFKKLVIVSDINIPCLVPT